MLRIEEAYRDTLQRLGPREGRWLFREATGLTDTQVLALGDCFLSEEQGECLSGAVGRREKGEPLQYILGTQDFMGIRILCDRRALIPRLDTECVCEEALRISREKNYTTALDLCCGTGAIGLALHIRGGLSVVLSDLSEEAVSLAEENVRALGVPAAVLRGDLFEPSAGRTYDLIVCNPPYIPTAEIEELSEEVREYEPRIALDGGADGLDFYRRLARECGCYLKPGGTFLCEIGMGQEAEVEALFREQGFGVRTEKDMQGIIRMVSAEKK